MGGKLNSNNSNYMLVINEIPASVNHPIDDITKGAKNRRPNWSQILKYKKRWEKIVKLAKLRSDLPDFSNTKVEIKFKFYHPVNRKRDHDNYFIAMKGMIDGLFGEDDPEHVSCNFPDFLLDPENPRVEIYITEKSK